MLSTDKAAFAKLIGGVYEFYNREVSEFALTIWWNAMQPFDYAAVSQAMSRHCVNPDTGQFIPKPADVVKMLQGTTQDSALQAWAKVDKAVRQVGTGMSVVFDDPLIHRVLQEMGGWLALGNKAEDEWPFVAKEFENRYRGYKMRSENPEYPPILLGLYAAQNMQHGFKTEPPILVGQKDRAMLVMQGGTAKPLIGFNRADEKATASVLQLVSKRETA